MRLNWLLKRLLASALCAVLPAQAAAGPVRVTLSHGGGAFSQAAAGAAMGSDFLGALDLHLNETSLRLGSTLPGVSRITPLSGSQEAAPVDETFGAEAAEYLSRATLSPAAPAGPVEAQAAKLLATALSDSKVRAAVAAKLKRDGGKRGAELAGKIEQLGKRAETSALLVQLGRDMRVSDGDPGVLDGFFDGGVPGESLVTDVSTPEGFASYAERRFGAGRLLPWQNVAVAVSGRGELVTQKAPTDEEMYDRVALSPLSNAERENVAADLFVKAGAAPDEIKRQDAGRGRSNVYVVKKGKTDRVVVVGAHHDKVRRGHGVIDNWTGTTMVVNLYQAMKDMDTEATYVFVAFAREEEGLLGSRKFVRELSRAQRRKIDAMVNLDTLAVDGTFSWKNGSDRVLLEMIARVAKEGKLDHREMYLWGGSADSASFRRAGIPAMSIFGASLDVIWDIVHTARDNIKAFSLPHYKNAYLLTLALLKRLDAEPVRPGFWRMLAGRVSSWVARSFRKVETVADVSDRGVRDVWHHGTSWDDFMSMLIGTGGKASKDITFFARRHFHSEPYARGRARKKGSKAVVLQFQGRELEKRMRFTNDVAGNYPAFAATEDIPLRYLTEPSKKAVLAEMEREWADLPEDVRASMLERARDVLYGSSAQKLDRPS